jgi:hypothetical protein
MQYEIMCKKPFLILIGVWEKTFGGSAAKNLPDVDDIAKNVSKCNLFSPFLMFLTHLSARKYVDLFTSFNLRILTSTSRVIAQTSHCFEFSVTRYFARQLLNKHAKNYQNVEKITKFLLSTKVV